MRLVWKDRKETWDLKVSGDQVVQLVSTVPKVHKAPKGRRVHQGKLVLLVLMERRVRLEFQDLLDIQEGLETKETRAHRVGMVQLEARGSVERMGLLVNVV